MCIRDRRKAEHPVSGLNDKAVTGDGEQLFAAEMIQGRDVSQIAYYLAIGLQNPADREWVRAMLQGRIVTPEALPVLKRVRNEAPAMLECPNSREVRELGFPEFCLGRRRPGSARIMARDRGTLPASAYLSENQVRNFLFDRGHWNLRPFRSCY